MSGKITIDDKGFKRMILVLQKRTGASFRDVIRGSASNVLANAARRTKASDAISVRADVMRWFRKPMRLSNGDKIGITKSGKVWFHAADWKPKQWVLVSSNGDLESPGDRISTTKGGARTGRRKVSPKLKGQITRAIREAKAKRDATLKYRLSVMGLSRATWLQMMRDLRMKIPGGKKLSEAKRTKIPSSARAAIRAEEKNRDGGKDFAIEIMNKVQASLNNKARGTKAFRSAFNSEVKKFEKNVEKDLEKYVKRFAKKNGFIVK